MPGNTVPAARSGPPGTLQALNSVRPNAGPRGDAIARCERAGTLAAEELQRRDTSWTWPPATSRLAGRRRGIRGGSPASRRLRRTDGDRSCRHARFGCRVLTVTTQLLGAVAPPPEPVSARGNSPARAAANLIIRATGRPWPRSFDVDVLAMRRRLWRVHGTGAEDQPGRRRRSSRWLHSRAPGIAGRRHWAPTSRANQSRADCAHAQTASDVVRLLPQPHAWYLGESRLHRPPFARGLATGRARQARRSAGPLAAGICKVP